MIRLLFVAVLALWLILWTPLALLMQLCARPLRYLLMQVYDDLPEWTAKYDDFQVLPIAAMSWFLNG